MPMETTPSPTLRLRSDLPFYIALAVLGGFYVVMILAMLAADTAMLVKDATDPEHPSKFLEALASPEIQYSIRLSLITCTITAIFSLWVSVPIGYLMARKNFRGKNVLDAILDIPIVLPPLVIGLSLLILFTTPAGVAFEAFFTRLTGTRITYAVPGVILAQFMVACAFAVRTMRATFEEISPRREQVALTLGCSQSQAFWSVALPEARRGLLVAFTLAWARSLGEFGPILIFGGATRFKTEVMPTSVFLQLSVGNVEAAVAVSMLMILVAVVVLVLVRTLGSERYVR